MANNCLFTTILIVVSSSVNCERRAFLQRTNNFQEAIPHNWKHDQEELNRNMVKNAGQPWGKLRTGPRPAPLRPNPPNQWPLGIHQNVLTDKEDTQYRVQQLQNKLMPSQNNILPIRTLNQPHPKPDIEVKLHKREGAQLEKVVRKKRDVIINPMIRPELALQPHIQPAILQEKEVKYDEKDTTEKRDKRQIMFVIKQRPLEFGKKPRTTPNPFIRETNIADYDIVKTEVDKPEIDVIETVDTDSYQLNDEASELSNILSNFYLTASPEYWPQIQQFADKVLKPLSQLFDTRIEKENFDRRFSIGESGGYGTTMEKLVTNKRVKRKLDKTLIRKRAKKRKQKQRRVERKKLRMLTHARRLRKQQKSKQARLQRHYARMNLTTTMLPEHQRTNGRSEQTMNGTRKQDERGIIVSSKGQNGESESETDYDTESDSENYNTESDSDDDDYDSDEEEEDSGSGLKVVDNGNDEYEDYDEDSSSNSYEYVDYENVSDKSGEAKEKDIKKEDNKKLSNKKETNKKGKSKSRNDKRGYNPQSTIKKNY